MITSIAEYTKQADEIRSGIQAENIHDLSSAYHKDFLFTAANWNHFFGNHPSQKVESFFKDYVVQKKLMELDFQTDLDWLIDQFELKGDLSFTKEKKKQPYIFASFHFVNCLSII